MAGRETIFGLVIRAKNEASEELDEVGESGDKMGNEVKEGSDKAKSGLSSMALGITGLNQGLGLLRKGYQAVTGILDIFISSSLKQRAEGDAQKAQLAAAQLQIERITGLIGDTLIPVISGITTAFGPLLDSTERYLKTNKDLIGSGVIEWFQKLATFLVRGVAGSVLLVSNAFNGWKMVIGTVAQMAQAGFAEIVDGANMVLDGARSLAIAFGQDDMVASIQRAQQSMRGLAKDTRDASDESFAWAARSAKANEEANDAIIQLDLTIERAISKGATAAYKALGQEIKKIPPEQKKIEEAAKAAAAAMHAAAQTTNAATISMIKAWGASYERAADAGDAQLKRLEEDAQRVAATTVAMSASQASMIEEIKDRMTSTVQTLVTVFSDSFADIGKTIDGHTKTWADGFKKLGASIAQMFLRQAANFLVAKGIEMAAEKVAALFTVKAAAVEGGSKAIAAHAGIPFVGLAIGAAAAAATIAAIMAFAGKMQHGGMVPDNGPFGDRHLYALERGEMVIDRPTSQGIIRAASQGSGSAGGFARGGVASGSSGVNGGLTVNVGIQALGAVDRAASQSMLESGGFADIINDMIRNGKLAIPANAIRR